MKRLYQSLLILALLLVSLPSYAEWRFGLMAEYNNIKLNWNQKVQEEKIIETDYQINNISGFTLGPIVSYEPIDYFSVQSGLYFAFSGYDLHEKHAYNEESIYLGETTRLFYLQVPLYAVGQLPIKKVEGGLMILLEAGPIFSGGVGSNTTYTTEVIDPITKKKKLTEEKTHDAFQKVLKPFDCSIHLALGFEYFGARMLFGYNIGVYDFGRDFPDEEIPFSNTITSGAFTVTIAYLF